jgi:hypothetical protein
VAPASTDAARPPPSAALCEREGAVIVLSTTSAVMPTMAPTPAMVKTNRASWRRLDRFASTFVGGPFMREGRALVRRRRKGDARRARPR